MSSLIIPLLLWLLFAYIPFYFPRTLYTISQYIDKAAVHSSRHSLALLSCLLAHLLSALTLNTLPHLDQLSLDGLTYVGPTLMFCPHTNVISS